MPDDGGPHVDAVDPVAEPGQRHRVQAGPTAGVQEVGGRVGEELAKAGDVPFDQGAAPARPVVGLVEVLGQEAPAERRVRPVQLGVGVERAGPGGKAGETADQCHGWGHSVPPQGGWLG